MATLLGMPSMSIENSPLVAWLFLRIIALVYLAAFASLYPQIVGLVGSDGILPATIIVASLLMLLGGCVVAPAPVRVAPPPRVAYVPPTYAIPGPGYVWAYQRS